MQIEPRPLDDPDVQELIDEVQLEYVRRYGSYDDTELHPNEFLAPHGLFLLAHEHGTPVGIGGWRAKDSTHAGLLDGDAELKRMYVRTDARRRGIARRVLDALERTAADAGRRRVILETGSEQPEAIAMYASAGYDPMPERYGHYADTEAALYFCKNLPPIRRATEHELPALQDIERAAGQPFADIGMSLVADDEPPTIAELRTYLDAARCWVYVDEKNYPIGYLVAIDVDDGLHIEQVSVHPDAARRGVGRALIDHAAAGARDRGCAALTLTTFRDVPWNAPYYERLGFENVDDTRVTPELGAILADERARGIGQWPRIAMVRALD
ncbi:GNAT family N-acetyltransferase [Rhodococcus sp. NPDC060090]|uniref:GNAT family N-acetyltransferase n=1 Tax=Rhodococcus sp. NPDC060090 TaxID=3347056 RepID=UPI00364AF83E